MYAPFGNMDIYTPDQNEQENNLSMLHDVGCSKNSEVFFDDGYDLTVLNLPTIQQVNLMAK